MNFKSINVKKLSLYLPLVGIVVVAVSSCTASKYYTGETDGVYFDPEKDQRVAYTSYESDDYENLVRIGGKYFDEEGNAPVLEKQKNYYDKHNSRKKYALWGEEETQPSISLNYMVSPYYSGMSWGFSYGFGGGLYNPFYYDRWGFPYYGRYYGMNPYWANPYAYNPYLWDPFYDPYYYGGYYPYYGRYYGAYYAPYYFDRYYPQYYKYTPIPRKKSGADAIYRGNAKNYSRANAYSREQRQYQSNSRFRSGSYERRNNNSYNNNSYQRSDYGNYNRSSNSGTWRSSAPARSSAPTTRNSGGFRTGVFK